MIKQTRRGSILARLLAVFALVSGSSAAALAAPAKMQAIVQTGTGGPEVLKLQTVDTPKVGPGQVRIKVYAAAINQVDWVIRSVPGGVPGVPKSATPGL